MTKGKSHGGHRGQNDGPGGQDHNQIINMDQEYRTHMLFPGKQRDDDETLMGRSSGSPSFMKSVFGTGWGRRPTVGAGGGPGALQNPQDPRYHLSPELLDPFLRGAKQVLKMEYSLDKKDR